MKCNKKPDIHRLCHKYFWLFYFINGWFVLQQLPCSICLDIFTATHFIKDAFTSTGVPMWSVGVYCVRTFSVTGQISWLIVNYWTWLIKNKKKNHQPAGPTICPTWRRSLVICVLMSRTRPWNHTFCSYFETHIKEREGEREGDLKSTPLSTTLKKEYVKSFLDPWSCSLG